MDPNAPYLPPVEPTDNPPAAKKRSARKTIVLWIVLIVMFIAIYQFTAPTPHARHAAPEPRTDPWSSFLYGFLPALGLIALVILFLRRQLLGGSKLNAKLEPGNLALADGDLGRAADIFGGLAHEYRKQTTYAAVARLSLATALMRQGELGKAVEAAITVERAPGLLFGGDVRTMAAIHLGMLYALRGDVDAATRWCDDARRRLPRGQQRTLTAALLKIAEVLVLARGGRRDDAARALDRDWHRLEEALTVTAMRKAWLLRAWCAAADPTRGSVEPWLTMVRAGRKGELAWLGAEWPELRAFLDAHDL